MGSRQRASRSAVAAAAGAAVLVCLAPAASAQPGGSVTRQFEVPGEVVVFPHSLEIGRDLRAQFLAEQFSILGFAPVSGMMVVAVEPGFEQSLINYFKMVPGVRTAERSYRGDLGSCGGPGVPPTPDPQFAAQWHLHNTGQVIRGTVSASGATAEVAGDCGVDIDAIRAWERTRGSAEIWLAVLDSGIDVSTAGVLNPEFAGRVVPSNLAISLSCGEKGNPFLPGNPPSECCCIGDTCDYGYPFDLRNHGTYVAATAAANHDGLGVMGVDPGCTILPVRVDAGDGGLMARTIIALETIDSLNDPGLPPAVPGPYHRVRVINMSYQVGFAAHDDAQTGALLNVLASLRSENVVVIANSGNAEGQGFSMLADVRLPSGSPDVITVGGTDNKDRRCDPATLGAGDFASGRGFSLDFVAPAFGILTAGCNSAGCSCASCEDFRCEDLVGQPQFPFSGTSAAAPITAGVVTLLLARADELGIELTWDEVYDLLRDGAVKLGGSATGHDLDYGWGRVSAYNTLMELEEQHYRCEADITHTANPQDFGYAVPDGKLDSSDFYTFLSLYSGGLRGADVTTIGAVWPTGPAPSGDPDGVVTSDDFYYFLSFYSSCRSLGLCPSCP